MPQTALSITANEEPLTRPATVLDPTARRPRRRYITDYDGMDLELYLCTEILGLESLHYGYWEPGDELTLEGARRAQRRYTRAIIDRIPASVDSVLDVGCGIGDLSRALAQRGLDVTALSPDHNHARYFEAAPDGIRFAHCRFEEFEGLRQYDLIVMSESHNYFDTETGLRQCERLLRPGGYLLISGMFRKQPGEAFGQVINIERPYVRQAQRHGLQLVQREDITSQTAPTLALVRTAIDRYLPPTATLVAHFMRATSPWKTWLLSTLFHRQFAELRKLQDYYLERTDVAAYRKHVRYLHLLFHRP